MKPECNPFAPRVCRVLRFLDPSSEHSKASSLSFLSCCFTSQEEQVLFPTGWAKGSLFAFLRHHCCPRCYHLCEGNTVCILVPDFGVFYRQVQGDAFPTIVSVKRGERDSNCMDLIALFGCYGAQGRSCFTFLLALPVVIIRLLPAMCAPLQQVVCQLPWEQQLPWEPCQQSWTPVVKRRELILAENICLTLRPRVDAGHCQKDRSVHYQCILSSSLVAKQLNCLKVLHFQILWKPSHGPLRKHLIPSSQVIHFFNPTRNNGEENPT